VIIICSGSGFTAGCAVASHFRKLRKRIHLFWVTGDYRLVRAVFPAIQKVRRCCKTHRRRTYANCPNGAHAGVVWCVQLNLQKAYLILKSKTPEPEGDARFTNKECCFDGVTTFWEMSGTGMSEYFKNKVDEIVEGGQRPSSSPHDPSGEGKEASPVWLNVVYRWGWTELGTEEIPAPTGADLATVFLRH
jgi:hypothetical protein